MVFYTDDERIGEMGPGTGRTDIDDLLSNGVNFSTARCVEALCQPSRVVMASGLLQQNNHVISNGTPSFNLIDWLKTTYETLRGPNNERRVQIGHAGKLFGPGGESDTWNLSPIYATPGFDRLSTFVWPSTGSPSTAKFRYQAIERRYDYDGTLQTEVYYPANPTQVNASLYSNDWVTDRALDMIQEFVNRPFNDPRAGLGFFLTLGLNAPHYPVDLTNYPPVSSPYARNRAARLDAYDDYVPAFWDSVNNTMPPSIDPDDPHLDGLYGGTPSATVLDQRDRMKSLVSVDDCVVAVRDLCAELGILDNTVFIYVSDNGYMRGEHGEWEGKSNYWEESLRIPMWASGPGFDYGETWDAPVSNLDLAPTISAIFGIEPSYSYDNGIDLRTLYDDPHAVDDRVLELCTGKSGANNNPTQGSVSYGVLASKWKLHKATSTIGLLYDLTNDPYELVNRFNDPGSVVIDGVSHTYASIQAELTALQSSERFCVGDSCDVRWTP